MQSTWKEISKIALIGTERSVLSDDLKRQMNQLGLDTTKDATQLILEAATLVTKMQRVGQGLEKYKKPLPQIVKTEELPVCSRNSTIHLGQILNGTYKGALKEYIKYLSENNKRIPDEYLPEILEKGAKNIDLQADITNIIGERGQWLGQFKPQWHFIKKTQDLELWEVGSLAERVTILEFIRQSEPEKAILLLEEVWQTESPKNKVKFLQILQYNLSIKDEEFLETCLEERRKEIRKKVVQLLSQLPDSKLNKRLLNQAINYIKHTEDTLEITLPEQVSEELLKNGIDPRYNGFKGGVKANRLGQMMMMIPPNQWEKHFNLTTTQLFKLIINHTIWSELLIQIFIHSSALHQDKTWIKLLLNHWIETHNRPTGKHLNIKPLSTLIPNDIFNECALKGLKNYTRISVLDEKHPFLRFLLTENQQWSTELTDLFILRIKAWMQQDNSRYWAGWHYTKLLKHIAYHCPPILTKMIKEGWDKDSNKWTHWAKEIEEFIAIVEFRKNMIVELRK